MVLGQIALSRGNTTDATALMEDAAIDGLPQAMATLAGIYNQGAGGIKANKALAYVWAKIASEAVPNDESLKKAVADIFEKLTADDKKKAEDLLTAKKKDLEEKRKPAAPAASTTPAPATKGGAKGKGK
jgi:TPR repeat protein